jgi:hypothetical protein
MINQDIYHKATRLRVGEEGVAKQTERLDRDLPFLYRLDANF